MNNLREVITRNQFAFFSHFVNIARDCQKEKRALGTRLNKTEPKPNHRAVAIELILVSGFLSTMRG